MGVLRAEDGRMKYPRQPDVIEIDSLADDLVNGIGPDDIGANGLKVHGRASLQ
jgi:hypothetical protein